MLTGHLIYRPITSVAQTIEVSATDRIVMAISMPSLNGSDQPMNVGIHLSPGPFGLDKSVLLLPDYSTLLSKSIFLSILYRISGVASLINESPNRRLKTSSEK